MKSEEKKRDSYDIGNNRVATDQTTVITDDSWSFDCNNVHQIIGKQASLDSTAE
jgi:hypothetical protein